MKPLHIAKLNARVISSPVLSSCHLCRDIHAFLNPVFQTHDLARIDAKVHRIFVEKFEIQILIKVVLPHRSFLNHLRIQF